MYLYFDSQGNLKEQINNDIPRVGASEINKVYIYWENQPNNATLTYQFFLKDGTLTPEYVSGVSVNAEIPYDKKQDLKFFKYFTKYKFYTFDIPDNVLSNSGAVMCYVKFIVGNTITPMGAFAFQVNGLGNVEPTDYVSIAQWNMLLKLLSELKTQEIDLNIENGNGEGSIQTKNSSIADREFAIALGDENKSHARKAITLGTENEITAFVKLAQKPTLSEAVSNGHYYLKDNVFILIDNTLSETDYNQIVDIYQYFSAYGNSSIAVGQINKILANCAGAFGNGNEITENGANGFVFGRKNFLDSYRGIIGGHLNKGKGGKKNQVLFGYALETDDEDKVVVGVANEDIEGALFEVGGGTYSGEVDNPTLQRKSIFWVKRDGVYTPLGKLSTASNLENGEGLDSLITKADKGSNKAKARGSFAGGVTNAHTENTVVETGADNSFGYGYNVKIGQGSNCAFGFGWGIKITEAFKYALGYYNEDAPNALFELGYGTGSANRKNLFTVFKDGRVKFDKLTDGTTTKTVQEILEGGGGSQLYLHQVPIHFTGFVDVNIPEFTLILNVLSSQSTAYGSETSIETLVNDTFNKIVSLSFVSTEIRFLDAIVSSFIVKNDAWTLKYLQYATQTEYTLSGPVDYEGHKLEIMTYTPTPL